MTEIVIRTERLELRTLNDSDVDWLVGVYSQARVGRFIPSGPWTPKQAAAEVEKRLSRRGFDTEQGALSLIALCDGVRVADIVSWYTNREHRLADIGWAGDPKHAGRGFVTEAASAMLEHAFSSAGMHRVAAMIDPRNVPSARVAERLGMTLEGRLRENDWMHGEWCDTLVYGILSTERRGEQHQSSRNGGIH